jgi:diguanylate cyclase (GGDEF)-like protein
LVSVLDTPTLRVAFGVLGICVVVLSYGVTYRTTRSSYSGWWCTSLVLFFVSALLFLGNDTAVQVVANPMGNTLAVLGAACVWAAARSLHGRSTAWWQLTAAPFVVMVASFLDDPADDIWTGGPFFLTGMAVMLGLSAHELWSMVRSDFAARTGRVQVHFTLWSLTLTSGFIALYYLLRAVAFVAVGPDDQLFKAAFGSQVTTLLTMVMLIVVTFSMSEMSHVEQTTDLREQATHDDLTGVLNRAEFVRRADALVADGVGAVIVADLDGFKALNDGYGHAAGDAALTRFAAVCREVVGDSGLVGRLGGDEFALLLPRVSEATGVAERISALYSDGAIPGARPTVSFGIAPADRTVGIKDTIIRADVALYQAKAAGRDRVVLYDEAS